MISGYNGRAPPVEHLSNIFAREIKIYGFIVRSLHPRHLENFFRIIPKMLASGEIKYREAITRGLEYAGHANLDVQTGKNKGKSVVVVAEE